MDRDKIILYMKRAGLLTIWTAFALILPILILTVLFIHVVGAIKGVLPDFWNEISAFLIDVKDVCKEHFAQNWHIKDDSEN